MVPPTPQTNTPTVSVTPSWLTSAEIGGTSREMLKYPGEKELAPVVPPPLDSVTAGIVGSHIPAGSVALARSIGVLLVFDTDEADRGAAAGAVDGRVVVATAAGGGVPPPPFAATTPSPPAATTTTAAAVAMTGWAWSTRVARRARQRAAGGATQRGRWCGGPSLGRTERADGSGGRRNDQGSDDGPAPPVVRHTPPQPPRGGPRGRHVALTGRAAGSGSRARRHQGGDGRGQHDHGSGVPGSSRRQAAIMPARSSESTRPAE